MEETVEERIRSAVEHKFNSTASALKLTSAKVSSFSTLQELDSSYRFKDGTFLMVIDRLSEHSQLQLPGFLLVECILYEEEFLYLSVLKSSKDEINLTFENMTARPKVSGISVIFTCNDVPLYLGFLKTAIEYYRRILQECNIDYEICLTFFGNTRFDLPEDIRVKYYDQKLSFAFAMNEGLKMGTKSHSLVITLDSYLSVEHLTKLIEAVPRSNGIVNFCKPSFPYIGIAYYFGEKDVILQNGYNEEFKGFFFEDTELIMNFSRIGIIPWCLFIDFENVDHSRETTDGYFARNLPVFSKILKQGHR